MERVNEKGTIKINKHIFGKMAFDAIGLTEGKAFSASEKGKQLTGIGGSRPTPGEISDHMIVREDDGMLYVELYPFPADLDAHNYESAVKNGYTFIGCFVGLLIVWFVDEKKLHFTNEAVWWAQILKAVLGLAVVLAVKEGTKGALNAVFGDEMIARAVRYCLVVVTAGIVWPLTFKWFAKLGAKKEVAE